MLEIKKAKQLEMSLESFVDSTMAASGTIKGKKTDHRKTVSAWKTTSRGFNISKVKKF